MISCFFHTVMFFIFGDFYVSGMQDAGGHKMLAY